MTWGTLAAGALAEGAETVMGDGKNSGKAMEGAKKIVTDYIPPAVGVGMLGGAPLAPGAAAAAGQRVGAAIQAGKHGEKILNTIPQVKDFIEGAVIEGPPAMTIGGSAGFIGGKIYEKTKKR